MRGVAPERTAHEVPAHHLLGLLEGAPDLETKVTRWREALHAARTAKGSKMPVLVVAHRGASGSAPENTVAAFRLACRVPCDQVEFDLRHTRDGQWVVMHDEKVDRTTDGAGKVADLTLAQIKRLDAGSWLAPEFAGERVPTLTEALAAIPPQIGLNVHVKTVLPDTDAPERELVQALADRKDRAAIYLMCDHELSVKRLQALDPDLPCGVFGGADWQAYLERTAALGLTVIQPGREVLCPDLVLAAHRRGMRVNVFWADTPEDMREFIEMRVDGILTNQPAVLRRVLSDE